MPKLLGRQGADLTIVAGAITVTDSVHRVIGGGTLTTLTVAGPVPMVVVLEFEAQTVVAASGNIWTNPAGQSITIGAKGAVTFVWNSANSTWHIAGGAPQGPQFVTLAQFAALSPTDGQEVYLQVDSANGINWHLRYNAGSASSYKWEVVGSANPLVSTGSGGSGLDTWAATSIAVTAPRAGEYDVEAGYYSVGVYQSMTLYWWPGQAVPGGDPADTASLRAGYAQTSGITVDSGITVGARYKRTRTLAVGAVTVYSRSAWDSQYHNRPGGLSDLYVYPRRIS